MHLIVSLHFYIRFSKPPFVRLEMSHTHLTGKKEMALYYHYPSVQRFPFVTLIHFHDFIVDSVTCKNIIIYEYHIVGLVLGHGAGIQQPGRPDLQQG
jgi:hypothetical protein